jgi:hypothetical protein
VHSRTNIRQPKHLQPQILAADQGPGRAKVPARSGLALALAEHYRDVIETLKGWGVLGGGIQCSEIACGRHVMHWPEKASTTLLPMSCRARFHRA